MGNFYKKEEIQEFYELHEEEIIDHYLTYGSSHFVGFFSSYINSRSQKEDDICSIHSDMASACLDIYLESRG
jgi:ACT domain-containing protein